MAGIVAHRLVSAVADGQRLFLVAESIEEDREQHVDPRHGGTTGGQPFPELMLPQAIEHAAAAGDHVDRNLPGRTGPASANITFP